MRIVIGGLLSLPPQLKLKVQPLFFWRGWRTVSVSPLTEVSMSANWRRRPDSSMLLPGWAVTITRNGPLRAMLVNGATVAVSVPMVLSSLLSLFSAWTATVAISRAAASAVYWIVCFIFYLDYWKWRGLNDMAKPARRRAEWDGCAERGDQLQKTALSCNSTSPGSGRYRQEGALLGKSMCFLPRNVIMREHNVLPGETPAQE